MRDSNENASLLASNPQRENSAAPVKITVN